MPTDRPKSRTPLHDVEGQPPSSILIPHSAFRTASSRARYRGGFIPQQQFDKDADTLILLDFSGRGTTLKDLAGNHDGRLTNRAWVPGAR
jgi:hypothetical protein